MCFKIQVLSISSCVLGVKFPDFLFIQCYFIWSRYAGNIFIIRNLQIRCQPNFAMRKYASPRLFLALWTVAFDRNCCKESMPRACCSRRSCTHRLLRSALDTSCNYKSCFRENTHGQLWNLYDKSSFAIRTFLTTWILKKYYNCIIFWARTSYQKL